MPDFGCVGRVGGAMLERRRKSGKEREMKAKGKRLLGAATRQLAVWVSVKSG